MQERVWRKWKLPTQLAGMHMLQPLDKTVRRVLKRPEVELPYDTAVPLSLLTCLAQVESQVKTLQFVDENTTSNRHMHPNGKSSTMYNSQDTGTPKCSSKDDWLKKKCIYNGIVSSYEKEWNIVICSNMNAHREYLFSCCCYLSTLYILCIKHLSPTQFVNIFSYFA